MFTVSLDEKGRFEEWNDAPLLVAGLVYAGSEEDTQAERRRVAAYYRLVCLEASQGGVDCRFPRDLHYTKDQDNRAAVQAVKRVQDETMAGFLRLGKFRSLTLDRNLRQSVDPSVYGILRDLEPRQGCYTVYAILNERDNSLASRALSVFVRDDYASNRYQHMAEDVLLRMLFHNPRPASDPAANEGVRIALELATRSLPVTDPKQQEEYETLGTRGDVDYSGSAGRRWFSGTSGDTYRTAIGRVMRRTGKTHMDLSLKMSSIDYGYATDEQAFLYLADSVCSYLLGESPFHEADEPRIRRLYTDAGSLTSQLPFVIGYGETDDEFFRAWNFFEIREYFDALRGMYRVRQRGGFGPFYRDIWEPQLLERMAARATRQALTEALDELLAYVDANNQDPAEIVFIYESLRFIAELVPGRLMEGMHFRLYDAGLQIYNDLGDSARALDCFTSCCACISEAGADEFLYSCEGAVISLCDMFRYQQALGQAQQNLSNAELLDELRREMVRPHLEDGAQNFQRTECGWALGQLAQVQAFLEDPAADDTFALALTQLQEGSSDYCDVLIHRMLLALDRGERAQFEAMAAQLYKGNDRRRLDQILQRAGRGRAAQMPFEYELLLFLKDLAGRKELPRGDKLEAFLDDMDAVLAARGLQPLVGGHPWELIYHTLAVLARRRGRAEQAVHYEALADDMDWGDDVTVRSVLLYARLCEAEAAGRRQEAEAMTGELARMLADYGALEDAGRAREAMRKLFTYTYR